MNNDLHFPRKKAPFGWPFIAIPAVTIASLIGLRAYERYSIGEGIAFEASKIEKPYFIIGYDRSDNVIFDPTNSLPKPSTSVLKGELEYALNDSLPRKEDRAPNISRARSISNALSLGDFCNNLNLPYQFSGLTRNGPGHYNGMLERDLPVGVHPVLVYCLPKIDLKLVERTERAHEYASGKDVKSYLFNNDKLEEIFFEDKK